MQCWYISQDNECSILPIGILLIRIHSQMLPVNIHFCAFLSLLTFEWLHKRSFHCCWCSSRRCVANRRAAAQRYVLSINISLLLDHTAFRITHSSVYTRTALLKNTCGQFRLARDAHDPLIGGPSPSLLNNQTTDRVSTCRAKKRLFSLNYFHFPTGLFPGTKPWCLRRQQCHRLLRKYHPF